MAPLSSRHAPVALVFFVIGHTVGTWRSLGGDVDPVVEGTAARGRNLLAWIKPEARRRRSMYEIGSETQTDKIYMHRYDKVYEQFLTPWRSKPVRLLEIGMNYGASAALWSEMFPLGELYGIDYKDAANNLATKRSDGRVTVYHGDQADEHFLAQFTKKSGGRFDVIIDDGGHSPSQQMISFNILFEQALKPGGLYIVEDIETNYYESRDMYTTHIEAGKGAECSFINQMKELADVVNRGFHETEYKHVAACMVDRVMFAQNSIVIWKRADNVARGAACDPLPYGKIKTRRKRAGYLQNVFRHTTRSLRPGTCDSIADAGTPVDLITDSHV